MSDRQRVAVAGNAIASGRSRAPEERAQTRSEHRGELLAPRRGVVERVPEVAVVPPFVASDVQQRNGSRTGDGSQHVVEPFKLGGNDLWSQVWYPPSENRAVGVRVRCTDADRLRDEDDLRAVRAGDGDE